MTEYSITGLTKALQEILMEPTVKFKDVESFKEALKGKENRFSSDYYRELFEIYELNQEVFEVILNDMDQPLSWKSETIEFIRRIYAENKQIKNTKNSIKDVCEMINDMVVSIDPRERSGYTHTIVYNNSMITIIDEMIKIKPELIKEDYGLTGILWKMILPMLKADTDSEKIIFLMNTFKDDILKK